MLENTERAIRNGKSRETGNIGHIRRRQAKQKTQHNMCWTQLGANRNNVNKTGTLLQTTGGKDQPNKQK